MLNAYIVQFNVTTAFFFFFFHLCQTLDTHKTCLWSAQQGTKESFEKLLHEKKKKRTDSLWVFVVVVFVLFV